MSHAPSIRALALAALLLPIAACSPLTPRQSPDTALWIPFAEVGLATIDRSTMYAIQHADDTDLLLFEVEDDFLSGNPARRVTWLIEVQSGAPLGKPVFVGPDGPHASGWVVEQISGRPSHAAPLEGTLTIEQRSANATIGVVNLYAITSPPEPGQASGGRVRLARKIEWDRQSRSTYGAKEPPTRGGITYDEQQDGTDKQPENQPDTRPK